MFYFHLSNRLSVPQRTLYRRTPLNLSNFEMSSAVDNTIWNYYHDCDNVSREYALNIAFACNFVYNNAALTFVGKCIDHFVYAPSQWKTTLQCNVVSHWLGAYTKLSIEMASISDGSEQYLSPYSRVRHGGGHMMPYPRYWSGIPLQWHSTGYIYQISKLSLKSVHLGEQV